jgi:hypothetical protein
MQLADVLGMSRSVVNRTLAQLRQASVIALDHRQIVILDREALLSLAGTAKPPV